MDSSQRLAGITHMSQSEIASEFENVVSIHQGRLYLLDRDWAITMAIAVFGLPTFAIIIICLLRMRLSHIEENMNSMGDRECVSLLALEDGSHITLLDHRSDGSDQESFHLGNGHSKTLRSMEGHPKADYTNVKVDKQYNNRCLEATPSNSTVNTEEMVILHEDSNSMEHSEGQELLMEGKSVTNKKKRTIRFTLSDDDKFV